MAVNRGLDQLPALGDTSQLPVDWRRAVSEYVTVASTEIDAPGAAIVIVDGDGVLFAEGFGVTAEEGNQVTPETPFHLASASKTLGTSSDATG